MKKIIALLLALVMVFALAACASNNEPAAETPAAETPAAETPAAEEPAEEPAAEEPAAEADPMADLIAAAQAEGELVVYGSCEEEYLAAACENFEKLYGIKTQYQRLSTGEVQAKIEEENGNPSADVWFGGTTDPYNVVAAEGLLEAYEAQNASHLVGDMYRNKDGYWYGIYKGILGFMVNTDELNRLGLEAPQDWTDLLKEEYKGLIWLSNYNTVGTGECVIGIGFLHDGITQIVDNGYENIELIIPSSGTSFEIGATAMFKGAAHPNAAKLWIEYALSPDCVNVAKDNGSYQFLVIDNAEQPAQAAEFGLDPNNVMDYDFDDATANIKTYVEEVMNAIAASGADTGEDRFKTE